MTDRPARPIESLLSGKNSIWNEPSPQDGYQAFRACAPGEVMSIDLVPANPDAHGHEIGYFQNWTIRYQGSRSIAILLPASDMIVFIEGHNLNDLRKRLRERRIAAIYEYNPATHGELPATATVVTSIHVEMRGDPETLYTRGMAAP
jgi:hypothetical protein